MKLVITDVKAAKRKGSTTMIEHDEADNNKVSLNVAHINVDVSKDREPSEAIKDKLNDGYIIDENPALIAKIVRYLLALLSLILKFVKGHTLEATFKHKKEELVAIARVDSQGRIDPMTTTILKKGLVNAPEQEQA